jgi:alkylation response protein AidB-like acyl-CoA dehydrogenase
VIPGKDKELRLLDRASAEFAKKELSPGREENDKYPFGPFFDAVLEKAYRLDFLNLLLPEAHGGIGGGLSALCIILYNICQEDASLGGIIFTHAAAQEILLAANGEPLLKQTSGDAAKKSLIAYPSFNNPNEISPAATVEKNGNGYTLSGSLEYLVLGGIASHALIPARFDGKPGYSFFLINLFDAGIQKSEPVLSLGLHACPAIDLTLQQVKGSIVGAEGEADKYFNKMADRMHLAAAAMSAGIMRGSFKEAFEYCKAREQGGRKILNWSEVRMILADMALHVKTAEMTVSRACMAADSKEKGWEACARAAALSICERACSLTTDGIQVLGGVGYMKDFGQEKRFRDAAQVQSLLGIARMKKLKFIEAMMKS